MTATPNPTRHTSGTAEPPTTRAAVGIGLLGLGAVGMAAKRFLKK
jgi:hypothetical protein